MPDNVRNLRGNPGKRTSPPTVKARPAPPSPPTWLDREAKAEWKRIVPELDRLGILARVDRAVLAAYCDVWSKWVEARNELAHGLVVEYRSDRGPTKNPAWQIYRDAANQLVALAKELGTSPNARLRMTLPEEDDDEGDDILD
jgi:P27 family predicted phage terminase small subunit